MDEATGRITGIPQEAGLYQVVVTGAGSTGTVSYELILNVEYMAPQIIVWPSSVRVNPGAEVVFQVSALGSELAYLWRKDSTTLNDNGRLTGGRSSELRIEDVVSGDAGEYRISVSNERGFLSGEPVRLTVIESFRAWAERVLPEGTGAWEEHSLDAGVANLLWYAFGAESADRSLLPELVRDGNWLEFHFSRSRSASGIQIVVEESTDLIHWSPAATPVELLDAHADTERWRLRVPATDLPRFFQIRAIVEDLN